MRGAQLRTFVILASAHAVTRQRTRCSPSLLEPSRSYIQGCLQFVPTLAEPCKSVSVCGADIVARHQKLSAAVTLPAEDLLSDEQANGLYRYMSRARQNTWPCGTQGQATSISP